MKNNYVAMSASRLLAALALTLLLPTLALAASVHFSELTIPMHPGSNAVAYPTILSDQDDSITSITSDCCTAVELHTHEMKDDIMRMRRVKQLPLSAGTAMVFAPGGLHIMLIGLKNPLTEGEKFKLTFHFAHAADEMVTFTATHLHDATDSHKHGE